MGPPLSSTIGLSDRVVVLVAEYIGQSCLLINSNEVLWRHILPGLMSPKELGIRAQNGRDKKWAPYTPPVVWEPFNSFLWTWKNLSFNAEVYMLYNDTREYNYFILLYDSAA